MPSDSGHFEYGYDALNQLISVTKDGKLQREYTYDAFGNRSSKKSYDVADKMIETVYKYNNKNQLLAETTGDVTKNYTYDLRGNIKTVTTGQDLIRNFTYDARNMLSEVSEQLNGITKKASYNYNGLGKRMVQRVNTPSDPEKVIRYTLDLTRDYHNMLSLSTESEGRNQADNYFYDFNVVGMSRAVGDNYFIQDDLGSPMSVINQRGDLEEAYAYDEFGQEYCNIIDARNRFQPLSYTGYQKEAVGDTYFAQARRYDASIGRFVSEDKIKGDLLLPTSLNAYDYCWNRPSDYIDLNGHIPCAGITQVQYQCLGNTNQKQSYTFMDATNDYLNDDFGQDIFSTGLEHILSKELEMPNFKNYTKNGKDMVSISDSQYYKGGRGGLRNVSEETLLNNTSKVGRAYRAQGFVKAIGPTVTVISGVYDGYEEYQNGAALPQDDRIINASVEGGLSIMSGLAIGAASAAAGTATAAFIGAAIGSVIPGLGTILGFAFGVALSIGYNLLMNQSVNGKTIKEWIKYGANQAFDRRVKMAQCMVQAF